MTTEHVSVPRESVEKLHGLLSGIAAPSTNKIARTRIDKALALVTNILSRATPSDVSSREDDMYEHGMSIFSNTPSPEKTSAPRVVTDRDISSWADRHDLSFGGSKVDARAAFEDAQSFATSLPAARVPDGWKLVPLVPTAEMEDAAFDTFEIDDAKTQGFNSGTEARNAIYKAMLAAAPQAGERR